MLNHTSTSDDERLDAVCRRRRAVSEAPGKKTEEARECIEELALAAARSRPLPHLLYPGGPDPLPRSGLVQRPLCYTNISLLGAHYKGRYSTDRWAAWLSYPKTWHFNSGGNMYLSEIYASGFRCFGPNNPLSLTLRRGLNILAGPNDAGKTAVIDAPRFVLWTRGDDFLRLEPGEFHVLPDGERVTELLIRCRFDNLTPDEESRFIEWCTNDAGTLRLYVCLRATLRKQRGSGYSVITQYRACRDADGPPLEGDLREYLRTTYLRPLRDAERELRSGRRSRLSRILGALPVMAKQSSPATEGEAPTLTDTMNTADANVDANTAVQTIQGAVNTTYLEDLSFADDRLSATLGLGAKGSFDQLLERLELFLNPPPGQSERLNRGLGYNNLLFMAAELLLLQSHPEQVPLLLIEEPEAHLHPQHQALFMQVLEEKAAPPKEGEDRQQVQVLLSTHSPNLAASANLEAMIMIMRYKAFSLEKGATKLDDEDYGFLRRFLDATKANLFFARGLIIVEGDAENILIPAIARRIGKPLGKHGVSIVKVGHRGLFRYSRILQRANGSTMPVPVALIPDRDIPSDAAKALVGDRRTESQWAAAPKEAHLAGLKKHDGGSVLSFPSEQWTLEFDLARRPGFAITIHQAVCLARSGAVKSRSQIMGESAAEVAAWQRDCQKTPEDIAVLIFTPLFKGSISKAEVAEQLARLIDEQNEDEALFRAKLPYYLVSAIDYATTPLQSESSHPPAPSVATEAMPS
jgi:putative ATP-dependent endonuclease of the OLD family